MWSVFWREQSKIYKSGNQFWLSFMLHGVLAAMLTSCQSTNEPNCEISRGIFQSRGVCRPAFPLLPSPFHFALLSLQLLHTNLIGNTCYAG